MMKPYPILQDYALDIICPLYVRLHSLVHGLDRANHQAGTDGNEGAYNVRQMSDQV